jgi:hypothetical protein
LRRQGWRGVLLFVSLVILSTPVVAQVLYGSIVGTVTDEANLAVPGATVTITHAETNLARETTSNETGNYLFPNVAAGTYRVDVTLPGFQSFRAQDIVVRLNAAVRVDAKLAVGTLQESVLVSADAVLLQTESAAVQTQTTSQQLENLPINGRSFQSALTLTPGVAQPNYFQTGGINNPARAMRVSVNGAPDSNTVFRLDGVSATNQWIQSLQAYTPAIEAIETVSVVTNSFDAEQGMAGGASVNVQIKSGTNTLRGSAFEYLTHDKLRARNYFLPADQKKTKDNKHVFGGTLGGPIRRDKLFYFVSLESTVQRTIGGPYVAQASGSTSQFLSLPPAAIRAGNFAGTGAIIYDPATGAANGTGRVPFAFANCGITSTTDPRFDSCNFIPANRINQVAKNILAYLPLPQIPRNSNNYFAVPDYRSDFHKIDTKITYNMASRTNVNGRFSYLPASELAAGLYGPAGENPLALGTILDSNVSSAALSATHIVGSNFVIDGLFGFTRQHTYQEPPGKGTCWGDVVGIRNACQPPLQRDYSMPRIDINGWSSDGNGIRGNDNTASVFDYLDPQWQWVMNAGWTTGAHNVKFGVDVHRLHMNHYEITAPSFNFTGAATALSATGAAAPNLFNGYADFLLGLPISRNTALQNPLLDEDNGSNEQSATLRTWEYGIYIRDQFQLTRQITVSAGVRWEYYPVPQHADRGVEIFDFTRNRLLLCGLGDIPIDCGIKVQKDLFTPRLGIAYRPVDSLVFRAGYSRNPQNDNMIGGRMRNFPVNVQITDQAIGGTNFTPVGSFSDGYPLLPILTLQPVMEVPTGAAITTNEMGKYRRGVISTFNVSMQKVLPYNFTAQIGYVGNRQNDMVRNQNINYSNIGGGNGSLPFNQPNLAGGFRTTAAINVVKPLGRVQYDSLQVSVNRRMANGFAMTSAYTFAKATDWWAGGILIPEYWHLNKGTQGGNTPHKVDISTTYELPFGPGKHFLANGGALSQVLSGWQVNSYFTAFSGSPFSVSAPNASLGANSNQRADQVKDKVEILGGIGVDNPYFDPTAFRPVTEARFGTAGFNTLRGPGYANLDMSVFRTFHLRGSSNVQFRMEVFNITNTPHFPNPGITNVSSITYRADGSILALNGFGSITGTNNVGREYDERYIRLGVRLSF